MSLYDVRYATSDRVCSHERCRAHPNSHERLRRCRRCRRCRRLLKELPAGVALIPLAGRDTRVRYRGSCDRIAFNRARISRFSDSVTRDTSVLTRAKTWLIVVSSATFRSSSATSAWSTPSSPTYASASMPRWERWRTRCRDSVVNWWTARATTFSRAPPGMRIRNREIFCDTPNLYFERMRLFFYLSLSFSFLLSHERHSRVSLQFMYIHA